MSRVDTICLSMCKYECVRRAAKQLQLREVSDADDWTVFWMDGSVSVERASHMNTWQVNNSRFNIEHVSFRFVLTRESIIFH
jgi:hypothetical protein